VASARAAASGRIVEIKAGAHGHDFGLARSPLSMWFLARLGRVGMRAAIPVVQE